MSAESKSVNTAALKNGVQSILVGFSILDVLGSSARALTLKQISDATSLSPSKVHSYLVSFCSIGMATKDSTIGGYQLGPMALKLGLSFLETHDVFTSAKPVMLELSDEIGQTAFLGVWGNRGPTILNRVDGAYSQAIFDLRIGSVLPVMKSALGLNLAAHLPYSIVKPFLIQELENTSSTEHSTDLERPATMDSVNRKLEDIRERGISRCRGGILSDFTAISAPVFDHSRNILCAITIMGPVNRLDDDFTGRPARLLKAACQKISDDCGSPPPESPGDSGL